MSHLIIVDNKSFVCIHKSMCVYVSMYAFELLLFSNKFNFMCLCSFSVITAY